MTPNCRKRSSARLKSSANGPVTPSPDVLEPPSGFSFGDLLDWHLRRGTREAANHGHWNEIHKRIVSEGLIDVRKNAIMAAGVRVMAEPSATVDFKPLRARCDRLRPAGSRRSPPRNSFHFVGEQPRYKIGISAGRKAHQDAR